MIKSLLPPHIFFLPLFRHLSGRRCIWAFLLVLLMLSTSGCSDFVDDVQPGGSSELSAPIAAGVTVGQTFVARHGGLDGIALSLVAEGNSDRGIAVLHLRTDPASDRDIAQASVSLSAVSNAGDYRFSFPPIRESNGKRYFFFLETQGLSQGSTLRVEHAPPESYYDGAMYELGQPRDRQLVFRLHYAWGGLLMSMIVSTLADMNVLIVTILLFVLPGWALLTYLSPELLQTWGETLGLSAGLSLALYPLLLLWAHAAGLQPGAFIAYVPIGMSAIALVWKHQRRLRSWLATLPELAGERCRESVERLYRSDYLVANVALVIILGMVFEVRLTPIRGIDVPLWADSVQHTAIVQLILDHDGLFSSWLPYWPYATFTQHFGFHANAAVWAWMTDTGTPRAVLEFGQVLNALSIVALYPLAIRIGGGPWAGVATVAVAGLMNKMPAFYVNWGRYAQLAGQAILPTALVLTWLAIERLEHNWHIIALAAVAVAGMSLAYYRTPYFFAAFWVAWVAMIGIRRFWHQPRAGITSLVTLAGVGGLALALIAPWVPIVLDSQLLTTVNRVQDAAPAVDHVIAQFHDWESVGWYVSQWLIVAWLGAVVWSILRRRWKVTLIALWTGVLASIPAGRLIGLPGASFIINFSIFIALYIPISLVLGWPLNEVTGLLRRRGSRWGDWLVFMFVLAAGGFGGYARMKTIDPEFMLVTKPDQRAMEWMNSNTPERAKFLVNGMIYTDGWSVIGSDAGWWIPLLTRRQNTMPPQYALLNERPLDPDYSQQTIALVNRLLETPLGSPSGLASLCQNAITHVYIGQGRGMVVKALPSPPDRPLLAVQALDADPDFVPIYREDRVRIYEFDRRTCQ